MFTFTVVRKCIGEFIAFVNICIFFLSSFSEFPNFPIFLSLCVSVYLPKNTFQENNFFIQCLHALSLYISFPWARSILLCLMKINLVFCSLAHSISSFSLINFFSSFHFYSSRSTHNIHQQRSTRSLRSLDSQENSEFLHLNQNQLHQSSVNVGFSNIAYNPDSSSRSGEVEEGTSTEKG